MIVPVCPNWNSETLPESTLNQPTSRFFIALLPPQTMQAEVNQIKQGFADRYESRGALRSPPHVTLKPPFDWEPAELPALTRVLQDFARNNRPLTIELAGYGCFAPRVIYIHVVKTPALVDLQQTLMAYLESRLGLKDPRLRSRPFNPHMTVAFRDLTRQNFHLAWPEFKQRQFNCQFEATELTLLRHNGRHWETEQEFTLGTGAA